MMVWILAALVAGANAGLVNPSFQEGLDGWQVHAPQARITVEDETDGPALRIRVPPEAEPRFPCAYQELTVKPGEAFELRLRSQGRGVLGGYGAYAALEFHDASGQRISYTQSGPTFGDAVWTPLRVRAAAPEGATTMRVCLLLNGSGDALFDRVELVRLPWRPPSPADGPVRLTVTDEAACGNFLGFGFEDDGWFYNPENAAHGVDAGDAALREARIEWMAPDLVRMFFWHLDWNPSGDWQTYDFDTPNMRSHYKTLDLYQRLDVPVNVTGVEWGMDRPYAEPETVAASIGALFEHLIRQRGYTCVKYWTLSNEPNLSFLKQGTDFTGYVRLHQLVRAEFKRRGLDVAVVGSDDASGLPWFAACVEDPEYFASADLFASHLYIKLADRALAGHLLEDRLELLREREPVKPLIIAEFGFQDARSGTFENPLMESYPYALWTMEFCIDGLNRGVAGFTIWCLHEVYYPGNNLMNYGLWNYRDRGWAPRPVYHAWAALCRHTARGDAVRRTVSSHPGHVRAATVGDTLFWVNSLDAPAEVLITGLAPTKVRIHTEATLEGDRETGATESLRADPRFTAPPHSFGYAR